MEKQVLILGGGQLGRMLSLAAHRLGIDTAIIDPNGQQSSAGQVATQSFQADFNNEKAVLTQVKQFFATNKTASIDVVTTEIEHVDVRALEALKSEFKLQVEPSPQTIRTIQDKFVQKTHFRKHNIPVADFMETPTIADVKSAGKLFGYPFMLKSKKLAYDGRGNYVVKTEQDAEAAFAFLGKKPSNATAVAAAAAAAASPSRASQKADLYAEKWVPFEKELAIMVARSTNGEVEAYPVVETVQRDNICHTVTAPADINPQIAAEAVRVAKESVESLKGTGIFGVELFLARTESNTMTILLNEIAPRPHNSGHYTIEACVTDQFEQHLRAILGLPLGDASLKVKHACMINILGHSNVLSNGTTTTTATTDDEKDEHITQRFARKCLEVRGAAVHWYRKGEIRPARKVGHVTIVAPTIIELAQRVKHLQTIENELLRNSSSSSSSSKKQKRGNDDASAAKRTKIDQQEQEPQSQQQASKPRVNVVVSIIMGSDSDLPSMKDAAAVLDRFEVPYEISIVSAHRTPHRMYTFAQSAKERGIKVIIAGAGGAAHLPGMVAAITALPVIGVPVKSSTMNGQDSLLSIVQMPRGVPVATVAIGNSMNAGLLAVRMLGIEDRLLWNKLVAYQNHMKNEVETKVEKLSIIGYENYLATMPTQQ